MAVKPFYLALGLIILPVMGYCDSSNPATQGGASGATNTDTRWFENGAQAIYDGSVFVTGVNTVGKYVEGIGQSTPSTPPLFHYRQWFSSDKYQICAIFDDGSTSCNIGHNLTLTSINAIVLLDTATTNTVTLKPTANTGTWTLQLPTSAGSNNQFLQTDGNGNTKWAAGGSGTITSGTTGHLPYYTAATTLSDASGVNLTGGYTFAGGAGALALGSNTTFNAGNNKLINLASATVPGDAIAYSQVGFNSCNQIKGSIVQIASFTTTSSTENNGTTDIGTVAGSSITTTCASNIIEIMAEGDLYNAGNTSAVNEATINCNSTQLFGNYVCDLAQVANNTSVPCTMFGYNVPGSITTKFCNVHIISNQTGGAVWNNNSRNTTVQIKEIAQ